MICKCNDTMVTLHGISNMYYCTCCGRLFDNGVFYTPTKLKEKEDENNN